MRQAVLCSLVGIALVLSSLVSACQAVPGRRATVTPGAGRPVILKFAVATDPYGPVSTWSESQVEALQQYFAYVNEGAFLPGIKLELVQIETAYDTARDSYTFERLLKEPRVLAFSVIPTTSHEILKDFAESYRFPILAAGSSAEAIYPPGWVYVPMPPYEEQAWAMIRWLKANHWKQNRPARVAAIAWDNAYGRSNVAGLKKGLAEAGWDLVGEDYVSVGPARNYTRELASYRDAKADYLFNAMHIPQSIALLQEMNRLKLWGKIGYLGNLWTTSPTVAEAAGADAIEGALAVLPWAAIEGERHLPGVSFLWQVRAKYGSLGLPPDVNSYALNFVRAMVIAEALRLALADGIAAQGITRDVFKRYLDKVTDLDTGDLTGKVSLGGGNRKIGAQVKVVQVRRGQRVSLSDWFNPPTYEPVGPTSSAPR